MPGSAERRSVLRGPVEDVAPRLLGSLLRHGSVVVRLTEVEAYGGADDPGSHAYRGRTPRNASMFADAGRLYCYLSYGVHTCANLVVGDEAHPGAVLLRGGEVVEGLDIARTRRPGVRDVDLARGPGRLCRALGLGLEHDGRTVLGDDGDPRWTPTISPRSTSVQLRGPRVGLSKAPDRAWRFWLAAEPTVSTYRRSPRAAPPGADDAPPPC